MLRDVGFSYPSLRFTEAGRTLLRWLDASPTEADKRAKIVDHLAPHCVDAVAALARENAEAWRQLADELGQRAPASRGETTVSIAR